MSLSARRLSVFLLAFVLASIAGGCGSTPADSRAPAAPAPSPNAWAVVDGREISSEDVDKAYRRAAPPEPVPSEDEVLGTKLALLDELIVQELLVGKARELQIAVTDAELEEAYQERWGSAPEDEFNEELTRRSLTAADLREALRRDLLTQRVLEREITSKVAVTDAEITAFFEANRAQFNRAEEAYHLAQIVVTPTREAQQINLSGDDAGTPQEATAKVERLIERLQAGDDFGELAANYSEHPETGQRGGDLGFIPVSALRQAPQALRDAVIGSEPGTVRVVSDGGAHAIVLVVAREPAGQRDLSMPEVKERITEVLRGRREQLLRTAYLTTLRGDATVENHMARRVVESQGNASGLAPAAR
jgi:peptidyl-prolyl cis-trans isomerase SurA